MSSASTRVVVHGASGRMGRELLGSIAEVPGLTLVAALDRPETEAQGRPLSELVAGAPEGVALSSDLAAACDAADVVIDFSAPAALSALARVCADTGTALVTGTTGLDDAAEGALRELCQRVPVVAAPNFSQGVTLLLHLAGLAAQRLGPAFDAEIVELHHRHKVDAPSGTAARLAQVVVAAKRLEPKDALIYGREGQVGARPDAQVAVLSMRGGDVVGEHTVVLAGEGERLELTHRATDRAIFARGALRAAGWVVGRSPSRYDMADVMGLAVG